jgi:hypothetical protein
MSRPLSGPQMRHKRHQRRHSRPRALVCDPCSRILCRGAQCEDIVPLRQLHPRSIDVASPEMDPPLLAIPMHASIHCPSSSDCHSPAPTIPLGLHLRKGESGGLRKKKTHRERNKWRKSHCERLNPGGAGLTSLSARIASEKRGKRRVVVIKQVSCDSIKSGNTALQECKVLQSLDHDNIVR